MSKVDWSLAKSWADRVVVGPLSGKQYWANKERRIQFGGEFDCKDDNHIREGWTTTEFKPKPWSGPEDGLPPVGEIVEVYDKDEDQWVVGKVVYLGVNAGSTICVIQGELDLMYGYSSDEIRKPRTPDQLAAEKRETAIADMAKVLPGAKTECYTFNADGSVRPYSHIREVLELLVDAGFKREVV